MPLQHDRDGTDRYPTSAERPEPTDHDKQAAARDREPQSGVRGQHPHQRVDLLATGWQSHRPPRRGRTAGRCHQVRGLT